MNEKPESDDFEDDDEPTDVIGTDDVDVERVLRDMDQAKRRGQKMGDPIWRRLERMREEKLTAELTSDFEDYDIGLDDAADGTRKGGAAKARKKSAR